MSILTQLRKLEKDRTRFKEIGKTATENYQALQPKYSEAVQSAKNYQSTLRKDYNEYVQSRNQAVDSYNTELQQRYQTYQGAAQQGSRLESNLRSAEQELSRLGGLRDASVLTANQLYNNYSTAFQSGVQSGQQRYQKYLTDLQTYVSSFQTAIETYQGNDRGQIKIWSDALSVYDKAYKDSLKDTGFVTRVAQEQSAGALKNYQNYIQNTYNPSVNAYNQYASGTYNPAAQAYQNFKGSGGSQRALSEYYSLAQDKGYVDRASSQAKQVYDASAKKYKDLQTAYQSLEGSLNQYVTEATTAADQIKQLNSQLPGLQRSLKVEQDPRKRETRIGYGRSLMTSGTKRRSSVR